MMFHKPKLSLTLALLVGTWIAPMDSSAVMVDFRTETFTCGGGPCSGGTPDQDSSAELVVAGVTWTVTPLPAPDASLYWDETDGFGVRFDYEVDEIEADERLLISFSEAVFIENVYLTDLFLENGYFETGQYELNGSNVLIDFMADASSEPFNSNGEKLVSVNSLVTSIAFRAPGFLSRDEHHEFSVAGISVTRPIPEPGSYVLFLVGAAIVAVPITRQVRRSS